MITPKANWPSWLIALCMPQYYPSWLVYAAYKYYVFTQSIFRFKGKLYPLVLNQAIPNNGGLAAAPKDQISKLFAPHLFAQSICIAPAQFAQAIQLINQQGLQFPLVAKPNNLNRGIDVVIIENKEQLNHYLQQANYQVLLEEFINLPQEVAVFINKIDNQNCHILSITGKEFLHVTGNGHSSIKQLLQANIRYQMCKQQIDPLWQSHWHQVPNQGKQILIQPIGNFNKGTAFFDFTAYITPEMEQFFTSIMPATGINHGRFDIKIQDLSSLETGKNFKIIEFNGLIAEPVSYHEPSYSFLQAQKLILRHARQQAITAQAQLKLGNPCPSINQAWPILRQAFKFKSSLQSKQL